MYEVMACSSPAPKCSTAPLTGNEASTKFKKRKRKQQSRSTNFVLPVSYRHERQSGRCTRFSKTPVQTVPLNRRGSEKAVFWSFVTRFLNTLQHVQEQVCSGGSGLLALGLDSWNNRRIPYCR